MFREIRRESEADRMLRKLFGYGRFNPDKRIGNDSFELDIDPDKLIEPKGYDPDKRVEIVF